MATKIKTKYIFVAWQKGKTGVVQKFDSLKDAESHRSKLKLIGFTVSKIAKTRRKSLQ